MYIVMNKEYKKYLRKDYFKKLTSFCNKPVDAYKFSAFELLLASKTKLSNKKNYIVYDYDLLIKNDKRITLLEDLYE